jgi:hypothetical protein
VNIPPLERVCVCVCVCVDEGSREAWRKSEVEMRMPGEQCVRSSTNNDLLVTEKEPETSVRTCGCVGVWGCVKNKRGARKDGYLGAS